tara:strand:+ start:1621 stop:1920 length:300 start_codon:yes stop_codon:yes gene_type:complete
MIFIKKGISMSDDSKIARELWEEGCNNSYDILLENHTKESLYKKLKREPFFLHNPKEGLIDTEILKEMAIHFKQKKNITRAMVVFEYIKHIESVDKYEI